MPCCTTSSSALTLTNLRFVVAANHSIELRITVAVFRAQWRSALHHVLEGQASLSPDDIEASLAESTARAEDLQAELNGLITATREASSWKAREQCLGWMEEGYKRAKSITKELRSHLSLVEVSTLSRAALDMLLLIMYRHDVKSWQGIYRSCGSKSVQSACELTGALLGQPGKLACLLRPGQSAWQQSAVSDRRR